MNAWRGKVSTPDRAFCSAGCEHPPVEPYRQARTLAADALVGFADVAHRGVQQGWSSQDFVDMQLCALRTDLELFRTDATQMTMAPDAIVERLDIVGHVRGCQFAVLVDSLLDSLFLQTRKEGLSDCIVPAVSA